MKADVNITFSEGPPAAATYFKLFESTGWNKGYGANQDELLEAISDSWYLLCAYKDKEDLVGFARIVSDGILYAFICDMIVDPAYQKQGVGTALMKKLIERCKEAGIRVVWLMAAADKSRFYQRFGFHVRPPDAPGMQLNLNNRR
jgi:ribosomal protein S18 acetylase RimI-like enzyme